MNILAKQHKITVNEERTPLTDDDRQETEKDDFDYLTVSETVRGRWFLVGI